MNTQLILKIIEVIAYVIIGFAAWYFGTNKKLQKKAASTISEAEYTYKDVTKAGGQKHEYVVDKLYSNVPAPLKLIITRDIISVMVDNTFNSVELYAKQQLDKLVDRNVDEGE